MKVIDMSAKNLAVVLLSGGLDSCVTMAIAREKHNVALLHVGYAQRTQTREYNSFMSAFVLSLSTGISGSVRLEPPIFLKKSSSIASVLVSGTL